MKAGEVRFPRTADPFVFLVLGTAGGIALAVPGEKQSEGVLRVYAGCPLLVPAAAMGRKVVAMTPATLEKVRSRTEGRERVSEPVPRRLAEWIAKALEEV